MQVCLDRSICYLNFRWFFTIVFQNTFFLTVTNDIHLNHNEILITSKIVLVIS